MDPAPDLNIIDRFMATFVQYIDSGFGLLGPDVAFLTTVLIGIDITLAGLWWAMDGDANVLGRLIKKILDVGVFALILNNFRALSDIIYRSFAGLGLNASGGGVSAADLLRPGKLASVGFEAAYPMMAKASEMLGFPEIFGNFLTVAVLLVAWLLVILAFFIIAIQLFITIIEFKLTSLAGFVLVPFALWNKTSFLAERVLGNVISSGIKVMVLAVIVGIGAGLFEGFTATLGPDPDMADAMTLVLGALTLLGMGIFGPGIASGLVSGAPQLGAGAAVGTAAGAAMIVGGGAMLGARGLAAAGSGGMAAIRAGTAMGSAASASYQLGRETSGATGAAGVGAGLGGMARAAGGAAAQGMRSAAERFTAPLKESAQRGRDAAWRATGGAGSSSDGAPGSSGDSAPSTSSGAAPAWAQRLRTEQAARARRHAAIQTIKDGDRPGGAANPDLSTKED